MIHSVSTVDTLCIKGVSSVLDGLNDGGAMSRPKPKRWSVRFELAPEREDDVRLHEYLDKLAEDDAAAEWIREILIANLPAKPPSNGSHPVERPFNPTPKPRIDPGAALRSTLTKGKRSEGEE